MDVKKVTRTARKIGVGLVGFPLLAVGLVLIPIPGPGVLLSLIAFFILSLEFDWAEKYFEKAKSIILKIYQEAKERADKIGQEND
jgi:hypothetical protein